MVTKHKFAMFSKWLEVILALLIHFALVKLSVIYTSNEKWLICQ